MPNSDGEGRDLVSQTGKTPNTVGPIPTVDLSFLPEDKRAQLIEDYAKGIIEIDKKARELQIETGVLKNTLDTMTRTAKDVSESGNAGTITYTQSNKIGRVEVKIGNTEEAKSGRMTSSQTGVTNWTPYYIIGGLVAIVLIAFLFAGHH